MKDIIDRHLNNDLQKTLKDDSSDLSPAAGTDITEAERREIAKERLQAAAPELAGALQELLARYVHLLESAEHGGWTLKEDETVRIACVVLARAGWKPAGKAMH
jgi:hypothetical protein